MRAGSNPGGVGHEWVKARFITGDKPFQPATYKDNPHLDQTEYEKSLDQLDHITRLQLKHGNWDVNPQGGLFRREWFKITDQTPDIGLVTARVRFWDLAATKPGRGKDPDYTVGLKLIQTRDNNCYITDVQRLRGTPQEVEQRILHTARMDGPETMICMEQEGGASGKIVIDHYQRLLAGYQFRGEPARRDKYERAKPASSYTESGHVHVLNQGWTPTLLDELESFPTDGIHDDQVDAYSGAFNMLFNHQKIRLRPRRRI
jgi:predicted phage terminase large subunit-like protein